MTCTKPQLFFWSGVGSFFFYTADKMACPTLCWRDHVGGVVHHVTFLKLLTLAVLQTFLWCYSLDLLQSQFEFVCLFGPIPILDIWFSAIPAFHRWSPLTCLDYIVKVSYMPSLVKLLHPLQHYEWAAMGFEQLEICQRVKICPIVSLLWWRGEIGQC